MEDPCPIDAPKTLPGRSVDAPGTVLTRGKGEVSQR
jgi:hypothetical protein